MERESLFFMRRIDHRMKGGRIMDSDARTNGEKKRSARDEHV